MKHGRSCHLAAKLYYSTKGLFLESIPKLLNDILLCQFTVYLACLSFYCQNSLLIATLRSIAIDINHNFKKLLRIKH